MRAAVQVSKLDAVVFTRAAAILVALAGGKEAGKDAVFGVEDGQVLISNGFDVVWTRFAGKHGHLRGIQIVRGRDAFEAEVQEERRGDGIGRIQTEVACQRRRGSEAAEVMKQA
jgi:hypothetical protein